ncbi:hypothetical protein PCL_02915 [Purpureocillium lilacinum]|uniref:Uncharacterized protein n=1 Tax=Purpureocillium lilacinum TaxID=33203 RepID=A0A2U3DZ68_PURLI|nr:hypothetical protein PCL_02915 [Purpureocillium lilacinum]
MRARRRKARQARQGRRGSQSSLGPPRTDVGVKAAMGVILVAGRDVGGGGQDGELGVTRYEPVKYRSWGGSRAARLTSDAPAQHTGTCSAFPQLVVLVGADSIRPSIHPLPPLTPARQPASPLVATPLAHLVRSLDASTKSGGAARVRTRGSARGVESGSRRAWSSRVVEREMGILAGFLVAADARSLVRACPAAAAGGTTPAHKMCMAACTSYIVHGRPYGCPRRTMKGEEEEEDMTADDKTTTTPAGPAWCMVHRSRGMRRRALHDLVAQALDERARRATASHDPDVNVRFCDATRWTSASTPWRGVLPRESRSAHPRRWVCASGQKLSRTPPSKALLEGGDTKTKRCSLGNRHSASLRIGKGPIYSGTCNILLLPPTLSTITDRARTKHGDVDTSPTSAGFLDQQHTRREQTRRTTQSAAVCTRAINLRGGSSSIEHLSRVCVCVRLRSAFGFTIARRPTTAVSNQPSCVRASAPPPGWQRTNESKCVERRRTSAHASLAVERPITLHHRPDHHLEVEPWSASTSTSTSSTVAARARTSSARLAQRDKDVACGFGAPPITGGNAISVNARAAITSIIIGTSGGLKGPASKFHNFLGTASPKTNWSTNNSTLDEASDSIATPRSRSCPPRAWNQTGKRGCLPACLPAAASSSLGAFSCIYLAHYLLPTHRSGSNIAVLQTTGSYPRQPHRLSRILAIHRIHLAHPSIPSARPSPSPSLPLPSRAGSAPPTNCTSAHIAASIHTYIQPARTAAAACDSIAIVISVAAHSHPPRHQSLIAIVRLTARPELHAAPPTWPVYALPPRPNGEPTQIAFPPSLCLLACLVLPCPAPLSSCLVRARAGSGFNPSPVLVRTRVVSASLTHTDSPLFPPASGASRASSVPQEETIDQRTSGTPGRPLHSPLPTEHDSAAAEAQLGPVSTSKRTRSAAALVTAWTPSQPSPALASPTTHRPAVLHASESTATHTSASPARRPNPSDVAFLSRASLAQLTFFPSVRRDCSLLALQPTTSDDERHHCDDARFLF